MAGRNTPLQDRAQTIVAEHSDNVLWLSRQNLVLANMPGNFPGSAIRLFNAWHRQGSLADSSLAATAGAVRVFCAESDDPNAYDLAVLILQQRQTSATQHVQRKLSVILACFEVRCPTPHSLVMSF